MTETFRQRADAAAIAWKATSPSLPDEARVPAGYRGTGKAYEFCVPPEHSALNLLPEARDVALDRFTKYAIPWHHGRERLPSNHLLSSQVACANALAPFVADPEALRWLFSPVLDIKKVMPFGDAASPDDHVTFEWVGRTDHLNERRGKALSRGAQMTSADAAIRFKTSSGAIEIALIEWKYTEAYSGSPVKTASSSNLRRLATYLPFWADPTGPLNDALGIEHRLIEPLYQLGRQQLLAWRMEVAKELDADRVSVVEAAPAANTALWTGVPHELGSDLREIWPMSLRRPDRWVHLDTARWLEPEAPTSSEFRKRYAALVATQVD